MEPHDVAERMRAFEALCHEQGLPVTTQRRVLIRTLLQTNSHPTADELWARARAVLPEISRTTVYRVLEVFADLGIVRRIPELRATTRFDANLAPHHHVICRECGQVFDTEEPACEDLPTPGGLPPGFRLEGCSVLYLGRCQECAPVS